jgi:hypothetical protein
MKDTNKSKFKRKLKHVSITKLDLEIKNF